ncbi:nitrite reductase, partial [Mycolicibacter algericus]
MRARADRCPGVLRPWLADDGLLVRLRLVGGRLPVAALERLLRVSAEFADGSIYLTKRANLQLRGLPGHGGQLTPDVVAALASTGLLPSRSHELVRNILVSPQTGYAGGRVDLRPVSARLDALLCGDPRLARLPGRFLFVLDDGRGDLIDRATDAGLVTLSATAAQLRIGEDWGAVVAIAEAAERLAALAAAFQA